MCQMLWWGMDKTLAELFAWHPLSRSFVGNPSGKFKAEIGDTKYGLNKTPGLIGLYSGRYTIELHPGE